MISLRNLVLFDHCVRKCRKQLAIHRGIFGQGSGLYAILRRQLRRRQQNRQFRPGQTLALTCAAEKLVIGCNAFDHTVQPARAFESFDQPDISGQIPRPAGFGDGQRQRLQAVILQHQMRNRIGHFGQQLVADRFFQLARTHFGVERDLDVDLIIRTINAGAVVDKVGIDASTAQGKANTPCLRDTQIGTFANNLRPYIGAVDANGIVARVTHIQMALALVLDIGPDSTKPKQLDRRFQNSRHQFRRFNIFGIYAQQGPDFRRCLDALFIAREDTSAFGNQLWIIIQPA
jgi:hypothetical protein